MSADGISLCSTPHPRAPWWKRLMFWLWLWPRVRRESLEDITIELEER